ncbi:MAG: transposase [Verrucomicrobiales bacterium]
MKIPRQTKSDNLAQIANSASLVVAAMERNLWATGYVQADETPIRCLDREPPGGSFRGYLWTAKPPLSSMSWRSSSESKSLSPTRTMVLAMSGSGPGMVAGSRF